MSARYTVLAGAILLGGFSAAAWGAEVTFQQVARSGTTPPGVATNLKFSGITSFSLADDGRIAFSGKLSGPGINTTNDEAIWFGTPGAVDLAVRGGDPAPGTTNGELFSLGVPNIDNHDAFGFLANSVTPGSPTNNTDKLGALVAWQQTQQSLGPEFGPSLYDQYKKDFSYWAGHVVNAIAGRAELSGGDADSTNYQIIACGPISNVAVVARTGFPAPGTSKNFTYFSLDSRTLALTPDGRVAFQATVDGGSSGLWFGNSNGLRVVWLSGSAAPTSLLGSGYTCGGLGDTLDVNARGDLAFVADLTSPGTSSQCVIAGPTNALRVVAQMGQPAPGITGAVFTGYYLGGPSFGDVVIGPDGTAAFSASYSSNGSDFGVWLAPTNGPTVLLMRTGAQAPGTPAGVAFTNAFLFLPPYEQLYMNARSQVAFRSQLTGPGVGITNRFGIWLADPDGTVRLVVRAGDFIDTGGGALRQPDNVTFGINAETLAGPEDGRACPFNGHGDLAFWAHYPDFTQALFVARTGITLTPQQNGNDVVIRFPTENGGYYRAEYATNLIPPVTWTVFDSSIPGTGGEAATTNANAALFLQRYFRAVRTN